VEARPGGADTPAGSTCGSSWGEAGGESRLWLTDAIKANGYTPGALLDVGPCGIHQENTLAVDPHGRLFECPGFVGHPEWAIGSVSDGIDGVARARVRPDEPLETCGGCSWRAKCAGGCLAIEWIARGQASGLNCESDYFAAVAPGALKRDWIDRASPDEVPDGALARLLASESPRGGRVVRLPVVR